MKELTVNRWESSISLGVDFEKARYRVILIIN